jgi:hypothetical protein
VKRKTDKEKRGKEAERKGQGKQEEAGKANSTSG